MKIKFKLPALRGVPITSELLFFISYTVYLFFLLLRSSFFYRVFSGPKYQLINLCCIAVLGVAIVFRRKFSLKDLVLLGITLLFSFVMFLRMGLRYELMPFIPLLFVSKDIKFEKVARVTTVISITVLAVVILSAYAGILPNYVTTTVTDGHFRVRHFLGFRYSLYPAGILFNTISVDLYAKRNKLSWQRCAVWAAAALWMFRQTNSRLSFFFSIAVIGGCYVVTRFPRLLDRLRLVRWGMVSSFVLCAAASLLLTLRYKKSIVWMAKLNHILEERLRLGNDAFRNYGIKLFGRDIAFIGNGLTGDGKQTFGIYNYVDCFYESILLKYGILFFAATLIGYTLVAYIAMKKKNYILLGMMTLLAMHGMIDDMVFYLSYNTMWFTIFSFIISPDQERDMLLVFKKIIRKPRRRTRDLFALQDR